MTKPYRPEGWENPYPREGLALPENVPWLVFHDLYEAGADAYAKGLKKEGMKISGGQLSEGYIIPKPYTINLIEKGHLVFIPEEE